MTNLCPLCGSDDLQKADDLMASFDEAILRGEPAPMALAYRASALRKCHLERSCEGAR